MKTGGAKRWLGMVGLALCLAACSGSSGGDNDSGGGTGSETPSDPGPSPSTGDGTTANAINPNESATLLADIETASTGPSALRVWDPAQPTVLVASQSPVDNNELLKFSWARSWDTGTGTEHQIARVLAFHAGNGRLWLTDLRGGSDHRPRPLSALSDVDATFNVVPVGLDGLTAWVNVTAGGVNHAVYSGMSKTTPALRGRVMAGLPSSNGAIRYVAVATSNDAGQSSLSLLAADGSDVGFAPVEGGGDGEVYWVGLDPSQAGRAYVVVNKQLRRLLWSNSAVWLDASFSHALKTNNFKAAGSADGKLWVQSGDYGPVLRIEGDTVRPIGSFLLGNTLLDAGSAIVAGPGFSFLRPPPLACCSTYEAMDKETGEVTLIAELDVAYSTLIAIGDGKAAFQERDSWGVTDMKGQLISGTRGESSLLGVVYSADKISHRSPAMEALVVCTLNPITLRCGAGPVTQLSVDGSVSVVLGQLPADTSLGFTLPTTFFAGKPTSLATVLPTAGTPSSAVRDLWQFTPGVAGSLQRVTQHLP